MVRETSQVSGVPFEFSNSWVIIILWGFQALKLILDSRKQSMLQIWRQSSQD